MGTPDTSNGSKSPMRRRGLGSRPLRCGVIGVGRMGRHHARVYAQLPDTELVGVVDANSDRAGDVACRLDQRRHHIHYVSRIPDPTIRRSDPAGPVNDQRRADAPLVREVLIQPEGRVAEIGPCTSV